MDQKIPNALLNKNIELITSLADGILNSLREELANNPIETAAVKESKSLKGIEVKIIEKEGKFAGVVYKGMESEYKKTFGEEAFEAVKADFFKTAKEAEKYLYRVLENPTFVSVVPLGHMDTPKARKDKQDKYVLKVIETISLLIENTQALQLLVKKGFALQATMIARNSVEILLRIIVQVDHYKSANYDPTKIDELKIENKQDLITYLQNKAKKNKTDFKGLENEAFKIVKEMFPDKGHPFYDFAKGLKDWYGELCGFTHPEVQLKERRSRVFGFSIDSGPLRPERRYPANIGLMINIFLCNALAVRLIIGLLKNRMKDENYDKNIINVDKAYDDFYRFFYEQNPKEISAEFLQRSLKLMRE